MSKWHKLQPPELTCCQKLKYFQKLSQCCVLDGPAQPETRPGSSMFFTEGLWWVWFEICHRLSFMFPFCLHSYLSPSGCFTWTFVTVCHWEMDKLVFVVKMKQRLTKGLVPRPSSKVSNPLESLRNLSFGLSVREWTEDTTWVWVRLEL